METLIHPMNVVRWIHIISGIAWFGEVVTINVVLVPALMSLKTEARGGFLRQVFPRVFRLASVLSATAVISGAVLNYMMTGWKDPSIFIQSRWGISILIGGALGLLLTLFHFFAENHLEPTANTADSIPEAEVEHIIHAVNIVPKVGMFIILIVILLMMFAARGI